MHILISDVSYFDKIKERLPAEFAKGNRLFLFFNDAQPLPNEVFEYISRGKVQIKKLPGPLEECLLLVMYELGKLRAASPDDRYTLWGDEILTGLMTCLVKYDEEESIRFSIDKFALSESQKKEKRGLQKEDVQKKKKNNQQGTAKRQLPQNSKGKSYIQTNRISNPSETAAILAGLEDVIPDAMHSVMSSKSTKNRVNNMPQKSQDSNHNPVDEVSSTKRDLKIDNTLIRREIPKKNDKEDSYNMFEETFQSFLLKLTGETFSRSDTAYIIESLLISSNASQNQLCLELFQKELHKYFPLERAGKIYEQLFPYYKNIILFLQ